VGIAANSLIISEFVCTQSFAFNCGCTQIANSLIISEFVCTQSLALKLRTHWVQPNSNCELIDYQWVRPHSKFCTQLRLHSNCELIECSRTQIANSLIISEFVCTQSFALNCGCTQTTNSLSAAELKLRTHWVQPNSNYELIDNQWVRLHSKFCTQLYSKNELVWICLFNHYCIFRWMRFIVNFGEKYLIKQF